MQVRESTKSVSLGQRLASILSKDSELKDLAQKYMVQYLRAVKMQPNKAVFNLDELIKVSQGKVRPSYFQQDKIANLAIMKTVKEKTEASPPQCFIASDMLLLVFSRMNTEHACAVICGEPRATRTSSPSIGSRRT